MWAWGLGESGQLGNNDTRDAFVPVRVSSPGDVVFTQVSAGGSHSLGVATDGSLWAWGSAASGQLGTGDSVDQRTPSRSAKRVFTQVSAGYSHSLAIASDGSVWAWGTGKDGRLGNNSRSDSAVPVAVSPAWGPSVFITQVSAGFSHSLALASDGSVWAWGAGVGGLLGNGTDQESLVPVPVSKSWGGAVSIMQVSAGLTHSLAVASDGRVWSWGQGGKGQLGTGALVSSSVPVPVLGALDGVRVQQVGAGGDRSLALTNDGAVWAWGDGEGGGLGDGDATVHFSAVPRPVSWQAGGAAPPVQQISAGQAHSLAVTRAGAVYAWGKGEMGVLGDANSAAHSVARPQLVNATWGSGVAIAQVSAGPLTSLAVTSKGDVWGWGSNGVAQLGQGDMVSSYPTPVAMKTPWVTSSPGSTITQVSAGQLLSVVVASDGTAWVSGVDAAFKLRRSPEVMSSLPPLRLANCTPPSTLVGQRCTLPGTTAYSVSYRYLGWSSPLATTTITR
nr:RCC1 domain-containing protein [Microbacterium testaceum]